MNMNMMAFSRKNLLLFSSLLIITISLLGSSSLAQNNSQSCSSYTFSNSTLSYANCNSLPYLSSFIHWTYNPTMGTVEIAYRHTGVTSSNWVVWSLNPDGRGMVGAQCLVALVDSSTGVARAYTSSITSYSTNLQQGNLSFGVSSISAEFTSNSMIIFATIELPPGTTSFQQVWQHGPVSGNQLQQHPTTQDHLSSSATIDFSTGRTTNSAGGSGGSRQRRRNVHGVLNVVSWGIMMPVGAMAARYLKVFKAANPAWFYIHVTCQASAYIVGVAGWGTGLKLGSDSPGVQHTTHRNIGITLFVLATLQVFALLLRPKPDHKFRIYWNVYHHMVGYAVLSLSIANIFEGFDILDPERKWKRAYIGVLIALGAIAVLLEAFTWFVVIKRKRETSKHPHASNGVNSYGA